MHQLRGQSKSRRECAGGQSAGERLNEEDGLEDVAVSTAGEELEGEVMPGTKLRDYFLEVDREKQGEAQTRYNKPVLVY